MKKSIYLFIALSLSLSLLSCSPQSSTGEKLFSRAVELERTADYLKAFDTYRAARKDLLKESKIELANECRLSLLRLAKITLMYPHDETAARKIIKKKYPGTTDVRISEIIKEGRLPHLSIGGQTYYFMDFMNTLFHIYPEFRVKPEPGALGPGAGFFKIMDRYIYDKDPLVPGQTLIKPINYLAEGELSIPRKELPAKGTLKVWLPLPLTTAAQPKVDIIKLYPRQFVKYPLQLDGDIALAYFEVPLEKVKGDLKIGHQIKFTHFAERVKVDPDKIGQYDKQGPLYLRYTASDKNIKITPAIATKARELAGSETNPYRIAKKFYDHIVWDLDYSFTPHAALESLKIPESVFVHEHGYGDCGAQSMYFAALCRSVGIPARASGGMQLFPVSKKGCGDHFWAQFYLPNYGWVPADTSAGQIIRYIWGTEKKKQQDWANYFFSNMEPFRYLIQVDVDVPIRPDPMEILPFEAVLQEPAMVCREMELSPGIVFMDNWKITVKQLKGKE